MNQPPPTPTRINGIEQIETALRNLEAYGYDTSSVWSQHNEWLKGLDTRKPTEFDAAWATRNDAPASLEQQYEGGTAAVLSAANCFIDRHFTLSPGMRDTLRERHGLTPAQTIIITHAPTFPGTNILWQIAIKSAEHIDPRRRKHVLVEAVITPASEFFKAAADRDKEREAQKFLEAELEDKRRVKKGLEPISTKAKALQYY
jgi:hypothetical protein